MLEVIDKGSSSEAHQAALLFVHGATLGAWTWQDNFFISSRTTVTEQSP